MDNLQILVSGVISKDGQKKACVYFSGPDRSAEGYIPDCKITTQNGFTEEEIAQLEEYMRDHLATIKREAAGINPVKAIMKE